MLSSDQRWFSALAVAAVALLPVSAEAQTMGRSFEELVPSAAKPVVVIDKAAQETRSGAPEVSFESFEPLTGPVSLWPTTMARGWLERAVGREVSRLAPSTAFADSTLRARRQPEPQKRSWIGRHPVLFGALVGFGGGFLIGYLPGDDGVLDDFTAGFNGLVLGGVGAGTGAAVGAVAGASTK